LGTPSPFKELKKVSALWQHELKEAFRDSKELAAFLDTDIPALSYPVLVPRPLALKIKKAGVGSALWLQHIPSIEESDKKIQRDGLADPIGDHAHSPLPQLVHRYKNRALFFPTQVCPVACRYCFRKNELSGPDELFTPNFEGVLNYLRDHSEINEVIYSGGDPLVLTDQKILSTARAFAALGSVTHLRFHTRTPIALPSRVNEEFIALLNELSTLFETVTLVVHVNHKSEIGEEEAAALLKLAAAPVQLLSQSVLLSKINDNVGALEDLFKRLIQLKVRPYYLHHPDPVLGGMHFNLSFEHGSRLMLALRDRLPGWALPQYVVERPQGLGKIPVPSDFFATPNA
jgi:lysine 2,3-aminomutase